MLEKITTSSSQTTFADKLIDTNHNISTKTYE